MSVRPAKTQISLGNHPVWSESSLSAWRNLGSLATHWAHSEDSDQNGRMPRLIWVFAGRTLILLVLSCRGSYDVASESVITSCIGLNFISLYKLQAEHTTHIMTITQNIYTTGIQKKVKMTFVIRLQDRKKKMRYFQTHE